MVRTHSMLITWYICQNSTVYLMIIMKVDIMVFHMVSFQTCHGITCHIIPMTHNSAAIWCPIRKAQTFFISKLPFLDLLLLTTCLPSKLQFSTSTPGLPAVFVARQGWVASSSRCSEFIQFSFTLHASSLGFCNTFQMGKVLLFSACKQTKCSSVLVTAWDVLETLKGLVHSKLTSHLFTTEALVTFSNPNNHSSVLQRYRMPPNGGLLSPRTPT